MNGSKLFYSLELTVGFYCPMRFDNFPLDSHVCHFQVGSYANINTIMKFKTNILEYESSEKNAILDYNVEVQPLQEDKQIYVWHIGNLSLAGFSIKLERNVFKYIIQYYLPSSLFVIVSWVNNSKLSKNGLFRFEALYVHFRQVF